MKGKILIVEDEPITAEGLATLLKGIDYNPVAIVPTGEGAIKRARELQPDLILMDIYLEGEMRGIEAAKIISEEMDIPIVFLTAYGDIQTITEAKESDPFGYILKPATDISDIQPSIELALHNHKNKMALKEKAEKYEAIEKFVQNKNLSLEEMQSDDINITDQDTQDRLLDFLETLSNPDRFNIFNAIQKDPLQMTQIQELIDKSQSTTSHHLQAFLKNGMLTGWKKGKFTLYSINQEIMHEFQQLWNEWILHLDFNFVYDASASLNQKELRFLSDIFVAIGNSERFQILNHLKEGDHSLKTLESIIGKTQSTIYHHMKILEKEHLIRGFTQGKYTEYKLVEKSFETLNKLFNSWIHGIENWLSEATK